MTFLLKTASKVSTLFILLIEKEIVFAEKKECLQSRIFISSPTSIDIIIFFMDKI